MKDKGESKPLRLMVVGSLPPPLGGTSVSLQHLLSALNAHDHVTVKVINTNTIRSSTGRRILEFFNVVKQVFCAAPTIDVITLHVSLVALPVIGPPVWLITRLFKRPLVIRRFGGVDHDELHGIKFWLTDQVIKRADCYLVQTRSMVKHAKQLGIVQTRWFPTSRPANKNPEGAAAHKPCQRFLYLSHIKKSKGIFEVIDAAKRLEGEAEVNVYGPFYEDLDETVFAGYSNPVYHGVLLQNEIPEVLARHDVLLLPTYYPGEGYPGIILEAFSAGLPVIASRWKSIPELVDDSCGLLIEPRDTEALYRAMVRLIQDQKLFNELCHGALLRHREFDTQLWTDRFVQYCHQTLDD